MTSQTDLWVDEAARLHRILESVGGYTCLCRVELPTARIRYGSPLVLNPPEAGRLASSRLSR